MWPVPWLRDLEADRGPQAHVPSAPGSSFPSAGASSALLSAPSPGTDGVGSGAGLELLLFSCLMGEASAMELWLLLSSARGRNRHRGRPSVSAAGHPPRNGDGRHTRELACKAVPHGPACEAKGSGSRAWPPARAPRGGSQPQTVAWHGLRLRGTSEASVCVGKPGKPGCEGTPQPRPGPRGPRPNAASDQASGSHGHSVRNKREGTH